MRAGHKTPPTLGGSPRDGSVRFVGLDILWPLARTPRRGDGPPLDLRVRNSEGVLSRGVDSSYRSSLSNSS